MAEDAQLLKGILEGCVLALLNREGTYGYRVVEKLREKGFTDVQEATVYPMLNRLNKKGLLSYEKQPSEIGPPRKVYALTEDGRRGLLDFTESWFAIRENVNLILKEAAV
jgi:PadR family transcriptional regulator PadR